MADPQPLAEIAEADASGRTAEIYAAIRAATGLPLVNLVWRHMAVHDGALDWAWRALEPAFSTGALAAASGRACAEIAAGATPIEGEFDADACDAARAVIAVYNHANPINLIALQVLVRLLSGQQQHRPGQIESRPSRPPEVRLPGLASGVDDRTAHRMAVLAALINGRKSPVMPTVLRHLAHWPALLDALERPMQMIVSGGTVDVETTALLARAAAEARTMPIAAAEARSAAEPVQSVIATFLPIIARMVVIGHALAPALADVRS